MLCVIMDIHPRVRMPRLMELRLGILRNVQAHFLLTHIPLGWHDLNETPAFPRWQWAMLLHGVGAGEWGCPSSPNGLSWKNRRPCVLFHISHTQYSHFHSSHPRGSQPTFKEISTRAIMGDQGVTGLFQVSTGAQRRSGRAVVWNHRSGWGSVPG